MSRSGILEIATNAPLKTGVSLYSDPLPDIFKRKESLSSNREEEWDTSEYAASQ